MKDQKVILDKLNSISAPLPKPQGLTEDLYFEYLSYPYLSLYGGSMQSGGSNVDYSSMPLTFVITSSGNVGVHGTISSVGNISSGGTVASSGNITSSNGNVMSYTGAALTTQRDSISGTIGQDTTIVSKMVTKSIH